MMALLPRVLKSIALLDDNTLEIHYSEKVDVSEKDMREILNSIYELTGNRPMKRLIVITKGSSLQLKARILLQEENKDRKDSIIAEAVVVTSLTQKMTTNFYLKFIKDSYPSKFFNEYQKAKDWLDNQSMPQY